MRRSFKLDICHQFVDLSNKPLRKIQVDIICDKLGMYDIYASFSLSRNVTRKGVIVVVVVVIRL